MLQVEVPAQLRLQPFVQFATQSVPPEHEQLPASGSHEQLPVHARIAVVSLPSPSTFASPGGRASFVAETSGGASVDEGASWLASGFGASVAASVDRGASVDASDCAPPVPAEPPFPPAPPAPPDPASPPVHPLPPAPPLANPAVPA